MTIPTGRFVWFEYVSKDELRAQAFFGELFHWKAKPQQMPQGTYTMIALGDDMIGGYLPTPQGAPAQAHWLSHLQVANVQDTIAKVKANGGKLLKEPSKMGEHGTMAIVTDNGGAVLALWQPVKPEGTGDYKGTDGSWVWNELYTQDVDKTLSFYKAVGGFDVETMKMGGAMPESYEILKSDGKGRGGVMKMPGVPQMWMPYVKVANADAVVAQAKKLGANVKMGPESVTGVGRLAVMADPLGAMIGILQPSP